MSEMQNFDRHAFLAEYWQRRHLLLPQSLPHLCGIVDSDDLAGLACEESVESRIVSGYSIDEAWECLHGPFNEQVFSKLPENNWTLLVQGVDQWIEEVRAILALFDFLPAWRLEDIMASYAPSGGGVGPHFDYYDVFLIQVSGEREWRLGQRCNEQTPMQGDDEVKLLSEFTATETVIASTGDTLYIPAGLAHWGRALGDGCITLSVGFRAASHREIIGEALELIMAEMPEHLRYKDSGKSIDESPYLINDAAKHQLDAIAEGLRPAVIKDALHCAFGKLVTEPRHEPMEPMEQSVSEAGAEQVLDILGNSGELLFSTDPSSRWAYTSTHLFVNGEALQMSESFSRQVCARCVRGPVSEDQKRLLQDWLGQGIISINDSKQI